MEAHRSHTYQRLVASGWSHAAVATYVAVVTVLVMTTIWLSYNWGQILIGVVVAVTILASYAYILPRRSNVNRADAR